MLGLRTKNPFCSDNLYLYFGNWIVPMVSAGCEQVWKKKKKRSVNFQMDKFTAASWKRFTKPTILLCVSFGHLQAQIKQVIVQLKVSSILS